MGLKPCEGSAEMEKRYFCLTLFDQYDNFAFTQDVSGIRLTLEESSRAGSFAPVAQLDRATAF